MPKYHIKPDGTPGECKAKPGNCPYSPADEHFGDLREALEYQNKMSDITQELYEPEYRELVESSISKDCEPLASKFIKEAALFELAKSQEIQEDFKSKVMNRAFDKMANISKGQKKIREHKSNGKEISLEDLHLLFEYEDFEDFAGDGDAHLKLDDGRSITLKWFEGPKANLDDFRMDPVLTLVDKNGRKQKIKFDMRALEWED